MYDALFDVKTQTLTEEPNQPELELIVECLDAGYLSRLYVDAGAVGVVPGTTLAVVVEEEADLAAVNNASSSDFAKCDEFTWQGYLK
jgi:hypothetical protein